MWLKPHSLRKFAVKTLSRRNIQLEFVVISPNAQASRKTECRIIDGSGHLRMTMQNVVCMIRLGWKPKIKEFSILSQRNEKKINCEPGSIA